MGEPRLLQAHQQLHRPVVRPGRQRAVVRLRRRQDPRHRQGPDDRGRSSSRRTTASARSGRRSSPATTRRTTGPTFRSSTCKQTPIVRITETAIETADGARDVRHRSSGRPGFDFGTGALSRMGIRGRDGCRAQRALGRRAAHIPRHQTDRLPELLLSRVVRTRRRATTRATTATKSTSSPTCSCTRATTGTTRSKSTPAEEALDGDDRSQRDAQAVVRREAATTSARTFPASRASTCSTRRDARSCTP